jgi:putative transposase
MTCFGNGVSTEYFSQTNMMDKINSRIDKLKSSKGVKKRYFNKLENRKSNLVKELHCKVINDILKNNDVIFYGDIKSHDIVKGNKNHTLNRNFNDLKFYKFKERLLFKATEKSKLVIMVPEHYTTKTCSFCGNTYEIKSSKVYDCVCCGMKMDRDLNSAKNMLLKGIINISDYIK